jgi:hypothetical protein
MSRHLEPALLSRNSALPLPVPELLPVVVVVLLPLELRLPSREPAPLFLPVTWRLRN